MSTGLRVLTSHRLAVMQRIASRVALRSPRAILRVTCAPGAPQDTASKA